MIAIGLLTVKKSKCRRLARLERAVASHAASEVTREWIALRLRESVVAREHTRHRHVQEVDQEAPADHPDHVIEDQPHARNVITKRKGLDHQTGAGPGPDQLIGVGRMTELRSAAVRGITAVKGLGAKRENVIETREMRDQSHLLGSLGPDRCQRIRSSHHRQPATRRDRNLDRGPEMNPVKQSKCEYRGRV